MTPRLVLTTAAATAAGYRLTQSPSGQTRVIGPDGTKYRPCKKERAQLVIKPRTKGISALTLRATEAPPTVVRRHTKEGA